MFLFGFFWGRIVTVFAVGKIYASDDAADSWQKVKREFGEIRAMAWLPY